MSDVATAPTPATPTAPKKVKRKTEAGAKKAKAKSTHPKTSDMVHAAIENLKERGGSSLQAIKKYISANYKVDAEKMAPFIRKYLKGAVTNGALVQTKGKGASGSFKLVSAGEKSKDTKKTAKPKPVGAKKPKATVPKAAGVKKTAPTTPKKAPTKPSAAKSATKSKAKKTTKTPTKKPKAPKPKKVGASKSPKKAAPKKK